MLPIWVRIFMLLVFYFNQVFRWRGRLNQADLIWAVPSPQAVQVCITLKGETSILMISKEGALRRKVDFNFPIGDAGNTFGIINIKFALSEIIKINLSHARLGYQSIFTLQFFTTTITSCWWLLQIAWMFWSFLQLVR